MTEPQLPRTIVLIDDDESVRRSMGRVLRHICTSDVAIVAGGSRAVLDGAMATLALLITDGNLGGGETGPDIIRGLREQIPSIPCILFSSDEERLKEVQSDDCTGVIMKPTSVLETFPREIGRIAPHLLKEPAKPTT